jgi:hypothetical protein
VGGGECVGYMSSHESAEVGASEKLARVRFSIMMGA